MKFLFFGKKSSAPKTYSSPRKEPQIFGEEYSAVSLQERNKYLQMATMIPIIDACIGKIIRLIGEFDVECSSTRGQALVHQLMKNVAVGGSVTGIRQFLLAYIYDLLVFGNAVGEMVTGAQGVHYLYNVPLESVVIGKGKTPFEPIFYCNDGGNLSPIAHRELILFTPLNPLSGEILGNSILAGCEMTAESLCQIFRAIGRSFRRLGDLRYSVTYHPDGALEPTQAKEIAGEMAKSWSDTMSCTEGTAIKDFIAVGDVCINTIGADVNFIDTEVPVRQLVEQLVAKLGIPPFIVGLNWSTTERMSKQQVDILTSELKNYRRLLTPVIEKICDTHLALNGCFDEITVVWKNINLQDEVEIAKAKLLNAQAEHVTEEKEGGA